MKMVIEKYSQKVIKYIEKYNLDEIVQFDNCVPQISTYESVDKNNKESYPPDWNDLIRLHNIIVSRKVTTILEFGVGYSTLICAHALNYNKQQHKKFVSDNIRRDDAFKIHSVDSHYHWINVTKSKMNKNLIETTKFLYSEVIMGDWQGRICTYYRNLPNICPDFIYLDAPDQFNVGGNIRNISTAHSDRMPMSADILAIEHFLLPGTLILVDGRTANARFLKTNLQRNWKHTHDFDGDIHYFELIETPLGKYNKIHIDWALGEEYYNKLEKYDGK